MYVKLFASLYQGTLRGKPDEILVFTNMLAHADQHGIVDMHFRAIAEEIGLSTDRVKAAIQNLELPDEESRSPEESGKRLIRMDEHRAWGWKVVNYLKYRSIKNEDDRREQNRIAQEKFRNKNKPQSAEVSIVSRGKPQSAHTEGEAVSSKKELNILVDFPKNKKMANDPTVDFETAWSKYPARAGGNSKQKALKAWLARAHKCFKHDAVGLDHQPLTRSPVQ